MNQSTEPQGIIAKLFSFFKLTPKQREHALKPKDTRTWIIHVISELIGTIFISLGLAGLSTYIGSYTIEEHFLFLNVLVGFFAGFVIVGLCLFIFLRWSCDLNPIVTITRYLKGINNGWYAIYKIVIQVIGALIAGAIILGVGKAASTVSDDSLLLPNKAIDAFGSASKIFETFRPTTEQGKFFGGLGVIFITEVFVSLILLFSIFSPTIKSKYRDFMILFIISMSVWAGILGGSAAINPARGLAQQLPSLYLFGQITNPQVAKSLIWSTIIMILGDLFATFLYVFLQGFNEYYFNKMIHKVILYKNNWVNSMVTNKEAITGKDNVEKDWANETEVEIKKEK